MTTGDAQGPSFSEAIDELEAILRSVENEETDIDELAGKLKRAAELLELCRGKIRRAEVEVSQIVQTLGDGAAPEEPTLTPSEPPPTGETASLFGDGE